MMTRERFVAFVIGLYPAKWRDEYGAELSDVLLKQPLNPAIVFDVLQSAVLQRVRSFDASTFMGIGAMLTILAQVIWNIAAPWPYGSGWTAVVQPSMKLLPVVAVTPLNSDAFFFFIMACGAWLVLRGRTRRQAAWSCLRISVIAAIPVVLAGILVQLGLMHLIVLGPGDAPTTFAEHGFALTYYTPFRKAPHPLNIVIAPFFRMSESWLLGLFGGWLASKCRQDHSFIEV